MKFALFAIFALVAKAAPGDACADDTECDADETCTVDVWECAAAAAPEDDSNGGITVDPATGMECTMDGYVALVQSLMTVALSGLSILKQIGAAFLPDDLRMAVDYAFRGLTGMGDWMGYALAAAYFAAEEFGFGETFCMVMGYLNIVLGYLVTAVEMVDNLRAMLMPEEAAEEEVAAE